MKNKSFDIEWLRQQFPALKNSMTFMDNAGGYQILKPVIDCITEYLTEYDVQLGASYQTSQLPSEKLDLAKIAIKSWINAKHSRL